MGHKRRQGRLPSQKRYDERNPTLSFRLDRDEYNKITALSRRSGTPMRTLVREAVGLLVKQDRYSQGYKDGRKGGYERAREEFEIQYPCAKCGKMMTMQPGDEDHKAMQRLMKENHWTHENCPKKGQR